ncbi:FKBP-type peptidyl-prolyl cis-trans isomerase [Ekhidna sp.]
MKKIFLIASISFTLVLSGCLTSDIPEPVSFNDQLNSDIQIIRNFLDNNGIDAEIHQSGIRYVVNEQGEGDSPAAGDRVAVKFTASSLSGSVLLSDTIGFTVDLNALVVEAWRLVLPEIQEGGSIIMYTPSGYAYGERGNNTIPANENIIFEVELLNVIDSEEEQFDVDIALIDEFLNESDIDFQVHSSGIRFVVIEEGDGEFPELDNFITVTFEGALLNGQVFDRSDVALSFSLKNLIECWQIMMLETKVGGTIKFYSPSVYCYGTAGSANANILPNTPLVFEIALSGFD